jgi:two-component system cell cycle sensor histidine kinase/response regulator CckA
MPSKTTFALAVDDEPTDPENVRSVLANAGYHVLTASDAKSAMEIFHGHADNIEVLVTDVAMSPVSGCDLAATLLELKPDLRVTFVSAYSGSLAFRYNGVPISHCGFVAKPFSAQDLLEKIRPEREKVLRAGSGASTEG